MILPDHEIRVACSSNQDGITITPFDDKLVQPASYDLRIGNQAASTADKKVFDLSKTGFVIVQPGDFVIITTYERLALDARHVGRFGLSSSFARKGLIATVGAQIDPGFRGRLILGLTNLSTKPITLPYKDTFLTVEFHRLEQPVEVTYQGPYQGRDELAPEDITTVMEREYMSQTEMMRTLEALVATVDGLKREISWRLPLTLGTFITIGVTVAFLLINFLARGQIHTGFLI